ncbi:MAG: Ig-like domain-containing protein [Limisphaerales bacterium]
MKTRETILLGMAMLLGPTAGIMAQTGPRLTLQQSAPGQFTLSWTAQAGVSYQPDFASVLDAFAPWTAVGNPVTASSSTAQITLAQPDTSPVFYRVRVWPDNGTPTASLVSPTANQTVSGVITVVAGAASSSQLASVTLYLDGLPFQSKTAGDLTFFVDTTHYENGTHQFYVVAGDNVGISYLGGNPDADPPSNLTQSAPITVTFQNTLRWLDACPIFDSDMSITAESSTFPTAYTVFVENSGGSTVRTWTGNTINGTIQDYWDGNDSVGNPVPAGQAYQVWVFLGALSSPPSLQAAMLSAATTTLQTATQPAADTWVRNRYGAFDYVVPVERTPLPPVPPGARASKPATPVAAGHRTISLREYQLGAVAAASVPTPPGTGSGADSGSGTVGPYTFNWAFKEAAWSSGEIILARQEFSGESILTIPAAIVLNAWLDQTLLRGIGTLVADAGVDLSAARSVYQGRNLVCKFGGDYGVLLNALTSPAVSDLYYYGHCDGHAIGFSDYAVGANAGGINESDLQATLGNQFLTTYAAGTGNTLFVFNKPFRFVFIDGCLSATGELPEAFGIPIRLLNSKVKKRAFLGWTTKTENSILSNPYQNFSLKFWNAWIDGSGYTTPLQRAIDAALANSPGVDGTQLVIFGRNDLTWGE